MLCENLSIHAEIIPIKCLHLVKTLAKQQKENRFELQHLPILFWTFLNYRSILFSFLKNNSLLRKVSEEIISKKKQKRMRSQEKDQTKRD